MEYEEFYPYLQNAFDEYIKDKFDVLLEKYLPLIDEKINNRINGPYTPELNKCFFDKIDRTIQTEVGNYLRIKDSEIICKIYRAFDVQIDEIIKGKIQWYLSKRTEKVLEALKI